MTMARKNLIFLFSGLVMLQIVAFFLIALIAQRLYSALELLKISDPAFALISSGGLIIGFISVIIMMVLVYEMRKEGFTLNVDLKK